MKLDESIEQVRNEHATNQCSIDGCTKLAEICRYASAYSELLKHAPEIGALVEAGGKATQGKWRASNAFHAWWVQTNGKAITGQPHTGRFWDITKITGINNDDEADAKFISEAANTRLTLKAIYDELKKWGKDEG